jgi:hypothetical protein
MRDNLLWKMRLLTCSSSRHAFRVTSVPVALGYIVLY